MSSDESDIENLLEKELESASDNDDKADDNASDESDYDLDNINDEEMEKMAEADPEFHKWLKKQSLGAADSDGDDDDSKPSEKTTEEPEIEESGDEASDSDVEEIDTNAADGDDDDETDKFNPKKITEQHLITLIKKLSNGNIFAFKKLTCMLVAAVDYISNDDEMMKKLQKNRKSGGQNSNKNTNSVNIVDMMHQKMGRHAKEFEIDDADDFNAVLMVALNHSFGCLAQILGIIKKEKEVKKEEEEVVKKEEKTKPSVKKESKEISTNPKSNDVTTFPNYKKIKGALRVYIECFNELLKRLIDTKSRLMILRNIHKLTPMLLAFPQACKILLERLTILWSHYPKNNAAIKDPNSDSNKLRILSFLIIVRITSSRQHLAENTVKNMYKAFQKQIKQTTVGTLPAIDFMTRTLAEMLLSEELVSSGSTYKSIFMFIRNLALTLRKAMQSQKHDLVYNWGFLHAIKLFAITLGKCENNSNISGLEAVEQMNKLVFPLIEITIGAIKLQNTNPKLLPFRLHAIEILIKLMEKKNIFIPIHPLLWQVVQISDRTVDNSLEKSTIRDIIKKNKKELKGEGSSNSFNVHEISGSWVCMLKFSNTQLQKGHNILNLGQILSDKIFHLYIKFLSVDIIKNSLGFVEFFHPIIKTFAKYLKMTKCEFYKENVKILKNLIVSHSEFVSEHRKMVNFDVTDVEKGDVWMNGLPVCPIDLFKKNPDKFSGIASTVRKLKDVEMETDGEDDDEGQKPSGFDFDENREHEKIKKMSTSNKSAKKRKIQEKKADKMAKKKLKKESAKVSNPDNLQKLDVADFFG